MKDRMIIIREGVVFVITVTHEEQKVPEDQEKDTKTTDQQEAEAEFPYILISVN